VTSAGRGEVFAVADHSNLYLVINNRKPIQNFYSEQLPLYGLTAPSWHSTSRPESSAGSRRSNLRICCWIESESPRFSSFQAASTKTRGRLSFSSLHLVVIDKISGTRLLDEKSGTQPGLRSITVNASDRFIELRSNSERVRLYPVDKQASAGQSGGQ